MQAKAHFPFFPPMGNVEIGVNQPCSILFHCSRGGTVEQMEQVEQVEHKKGAPVWERPLYCY